MSRKYIITVSFDKREKELNHNPKAKACGECPLSDYCTDVTGRHHSILVEANDIGEARGKIRTLLSGEHPSYHITRLEVVKELSQ